MGNYKKVTKITARKMFNYGITLFLIPCKVNPKYAFDNASKVIYVNPVVIRKSLDEEIDEEFDKLVNNYEYYNCNSGIGRYAHYYVREVDYEVYCCSV